MIRSGFNFWRMLYQLADPYADVFVRGAKKP